jgi:hydroxyethylthiazole kinase-like uncharacterized protein yjeF
VKILTVAQTQQAERDCSRFGISLERLMENAGLAVAAETRRILGDLQNKSLLILVGPGHNGGDGLVAAMHLSDWGAAVTVCLCAQRPAHDSNLEKLRSRKIEIFEASCDSGPELLQVALGRSLAVIDSIFGTGQNRPVTGIFAQVLNTVNEYKKKHSHPCLIALDLPSGLNADSGSTDPATPAVDHTLTLGFPKVGLFNLAGQEKAGAITVVDIGIPSEVVSAVNLDLMDNAWAREVLPYRPRIANKGTFGKILALVGSPNYIGAAYLSCSGSLRVGAGLTTLAISNSLIPVLASKLTEVTYLPLPEAAGKTDDSESLKLMQETLPKYDVLLLGCGISLSETTVNLVKALLLKPKTRLPPVILDADGLNILALTSDWHLKLEAQAVITPHAGEMSRLLGKSIQEIQSNRINSAREAALKWRQTVVLKGANTVIASPDGKVRVSPFSNPGLASAGTGDVLAGAIAGMAAQGLSLFDAASAGVYVHGLAGELVRAELGDAGMLASDLLPCLPRAIRQLKQA